MHHITRTFHKLFIPSHRNNFRSKALHLDFLVALLLITTLFSGAASWLEEAEVLGFAKDIRIDRLYALTNEVRTQNGLPPLRYNDKLAQAASNKAQHMISNDYWAHFGDGKSPWDFILDAGYSYEVAGENLAKGFMYSDSVVDGWKASPTHYANLVRPEYDEIGFAVTNGVLQGEEITLVVQMFGKQLAEANTQPSKEDTQFAQAPVQAEELEEDGVEDSTSDGNDKVAAQVNPTGPVGSADTPKVLKATGVSTSQPGFATSSFLSVDALQFTWTRFIIGFLIAALALDVYFAHKLHLVRLSGKNIAHIVFLATIVIGLLIVKNGVIL